MGITRIHVVKNRLKRSIQYVTACSKTAVAQKFQQLETAQTPADKLYCDVINCRSADTAYQEMMRTKEQFGKLDGVQAYHVIQSFSDADAGLTPALAHQIGMEFAWQCFGEKYQVLVATHLNRPHLHNHILLNSVGCFDGKKYHSCTGSYYQQIRGTSDALCRKYGLCVAVPCGKTESYAAYQAQKQGGLTIRTMVRQDVDKARQAAYSWESFVLYLQRMGYRVIRGQDAAHCWLQHSLGRYRLSLRALGQGYTEAALRQYFAEKGGPVRLPVPSARPQAKKKARGRLRTPADRVRRLGGYPAQYLYFLFLLQRAKDRRLCTKSYYLLREALLSLPDYQSRAAFVWEYRIETPALLDAHLHRTEAEMQRIADLRQKVYDRRCHGTDETRQALLPRMQQYTDRLRQLRKERQLCEAIARDEQDIRQKIAAARQNEQKNQTREERIQHEYRR